MKSFELFTTRHKHLINESSNKFFQIGHIFEEPHFYCKQSYCKQLQKQHFLQTNKKIRSFNKLMFIEQTFRKQNSKDQQFFLQKFQTIHSRKKPQFPLFNFSQRSHTTNIQEQKQQIKQRIVQGFQLRNDIRSQAIKNKKIVNKNLLTKTHQRLISVNIKNNNTFSFRLKTKNIKQKNFFSR